MRRALREHRDTRPHRRSPDGVTQSPEVRLSRRGQDSLAGVGGAVGARSHAQTPLAPLVAGGLPLVANQLSGERLMGGARGQASGWSGPERAGG